MAAVLTYDLRRGYLSVIVSGRTIFVPTYQEASRITAWEKVQEQRSGRHTLWEHCYEFRSGKHAIQDSVQVGKVIHRITVDQGDKLDVYDYPGRYASKPPGEADPKSRGVRHTFLGKAVFIGDPGGGIHIHGWPPCNLKQCIIVLQRWEEMFQTIARDRELSFSIE